MYTQPHQKYKWFKILIEIYIFKDEIKIPIYLLYAIYKKSVTHGRGGLHPPEPH